MPDIFRYGKGDQVRRYDFRVVPGGAELWRITEKPGCPPIEVKEDDFRSARAAEACFEEIERALIAGGWRQL